MQSPRDAADDAGTALRAGFFPIILAIPAKKVKSGFLCIDHSLDGLMEISDFSCY